MREAARNVVTGASRPLFWATVFAICVGSLAMLDALNVSQIVAEEQAFSSAGGNVLVIEAPGNVDGTRCSSIEEASGVRKSGALRTAGETVFASMPTTPIATFEVTPGFAEIIDAGAEQPGVLVSSALAQTVGTHTAQPVLPTGTVGVMGSYAYPADGRMPLLEYAALAQVPRHERFDQCWVRFQETSHMDRALLLFAVDDAGDDGSLATQYQLNATLGEDYDLAEVLDQRPTRYSLVIAVFMGLAVGGLAVWTRRLHLASMLHLRVPRAVVAMQSVLEASASVIAGCALVGAACTVLYMLRAIDAPNGVVAGVATTAAAGCATVLGASITALGVREQQLYRFHRTR